MAEYRVLPGAPEKIQATMAALKIQPADRSYTPAIASRHQQRFYMTPVKTNRGPLVWFKASLKESPDVRRSLREEIKVQQLFTAYERRRRPRFDSPSYISSHDDHHGFLWLMRRYWEGVFAGDMTDVFGLANIFFQAVSGPAMARIIGDVRGMTSFLRPRLPLDTHTLGWYMLDYHYYRKNFLLPFGRHPLGTNWTRTKTDSIGSTLTAYRAFISRQATYFTHGDMYPTNIMVRPRAGRPVVIFDWELAHLNLASFDAVMLYLHAWRRPTWQAAFKKTTLTLLGDTPASRRAWNIATLSLATRLAGFSFIRLTNRQPERYPRLLRTSAPILHRMLARMTNELNQALAEL